MLQHLSPAVSWNFSYVGRRPWLTGGPLDAIYEFETLYVFAHSSEHSIDNQKSDFEIQYVFRNIDYASYELASQYVNGLVIVAVLGQVNDTSPVDLPLLNDMSQVQQPPIDSDTEYLAIGEQTDYNLKDLIDLSKDNKFFMYHGSTTTDPYCEVVTWIVSLQKYSVSSEQVSLRSKRKCLLVCKPFCNSFFS